MLALLVTSVLISEHACRLHSGLWRLHGAADPHLRRLLGARHRRDSPRPALADADGRRAQPVRHHAIERRANARASRFSPLPSRSMASGVRSRLGIGSKLAMQMTLDWWNFEESVAGFFVHCVAIAGLYMFLTYYIAEMDSAAEAQADSRAAVSELTAHAAMPISGAVCWSAWQTNAAEAVTGRSRASEGAEPSRRRQSLARSPATPGLRGLWSPDPAVGQPRL